VPNNPLQDAINELMTLHKLGRLADMEARARVSLKSFSGKPVLRELLGMALAGQNRFAEALPFLERAVRDDPREPVFWENLALCQCQLGELAGAESSLREGLERNPQSAEMLVSLGSILRSLERADEAQDLLERALAIEPGHAAAHYQLGEILAARNHLERSEHHLRQSLAVDRNVAAAHNALGGVLGQKGELVAAAASFARAIALDGASPVGHANLAIALGALNRTQEAASVARTALGLLGNLEASVSPERLALIDGIANVLLAAGYAEEALKIYKVTIRVENKPLRALSATYAARLVCDWEFAAALEPQACRVAEHASTIDESAPLRLLSLALATPAQQLAATRKCARQAMSAAVSADSVPVLPDVSRRDTARGKLRVGYLSTDFHNHATAHITAGVIEAHDRDRLEIIAYDLSPRIDDEYHMRLERAFDRMVQLDALTDRDAAQRIADDQIDIMVDLKGWTKGTRPGLLIPRPAALQVQWFGFPGSVGAPWIDYIVADHVVIEPQDEENYSEKIIRLPDTYYPSDDKRPVANTLGRTAYGLPEEAFVFCCFNQVHKLTPEVFDTWIELLAAVDRSVLWFWQPQDAAIRALRERLARRGIDAARLVIAPTMPAPEHRARLARADLALDCYPYGSHTTAGDALWAGVPLVALRGDTFVSRVSASLLTAAGLPELIATSLEDYARLAIRLATDRDEMARVRAHIAARRQNAGLFDTTRFTRNLEAAYLAISQRQREGLPPDHIAIT
jgi:protein O-GlcNAc transferase